MRGELNLKKLYKKMFFLDKITQFLWSYARIISELLSIVTARVSYFLIMVLFSSVHGADIDFDLDIKHVIGSYNQQLLSSHVNPIDCPKSAHVKYSSGWLRLFSFAYFFNSLSKADVIPNDGRVIGLPPQTVDISWSGQFFCGIIDPVLKPSYGCYNTTESDVGIYWLQYSTGMITFDSDHTTEVSPLKYPCLTQWKDVGSVRHCETQYYHLEHEVAFHNVENLWHYTGRYRDYGPPSGYEFLNSTAIKNENFSKPIRIKDELVQSINITKYYIRPNGSVTSEITQHKDCPLHVFHVRFERTNADSSLYLQVVKTICKDTLVDKNFRLDDVLFSEHNLRYFTFLKPDKALARDDFRNSLWFNRYFLIDNNMQLMTQDLMILGGVVYGFHKLGIFPRLKKSLFFRILYENTKRKNDPLTLVDNNLHQD